MIGMHRCMWTVILTSIICVWLLVIPGEAAVSCRQCSSSRLVNITNIQNNQDITIIFPSMYNPYCRAGAQGQTTPTVISQQQQANIITIFPCTSTVVAETNTEIRCGYYNGYMTARTTVGDGRFTMSTFSMRCFQVLTSVNYGCRTMDGLTADDRAHFEDLLSRRFQSLVTFETFVGSRCYCRDPDCADISSAPKQTIANVVLTILTLCLSFVFSIL